jgi:CelD/BcsL family acetyltransferase involved in cellulose biosynthesis
MAMTVATSIPMRELGRATDADLHLETFTSFADIEAHAPEWEALVSELNGSLYLTPDWCRVWWRHYGDGRELRLILVRDEEGLAGVLPFFLDRVGLPFARARVAKLVGCDFTIAVVDPPVQPDVATEARARAIRQLFEHDKCDIVQIGPSSAASPQLEGLRRSAAEVDDVAQIIREGESGARTVFEIPHGFDAYLKSLSKNQRSNYRRNVNRLNKAYAFELDVVRGGPELEREFEAFAEMHQAQWNAVNKLGHFGDWPRSLEFTRDLVKTLARADRVRLIRLLADERVVSYYFCFEFDGTYYWRLPARLVGQPWDQLALGRVGLIKMLEVAAEEGATSVEAGIGKYEYKEKLNAKTLPVHSLALCRKGLASRCRARLAIALGDLLQLAYYRVWFVRVAPRLGVPLRPLWRSWIRSRF